MNKSTRAMMHCVVSALIGNVMKMDCDDWPVIEESSDIRKDLKMDSADLTNFTIKLEFETKAGIDPNHIAYNCNTVGDIVDYAAKLVRGKRRGSK